MIFILCQKVWFQLPTVPCGFDLEGLFACNFKLFNFLIGSSGEFERGVKPLMWLTWSLIEERNLKSLRCNLVFWFQVKGFWKKKRLVQGHSMSSHPVMTPTLSDFDETWHNWFYFYPDNSRKIFLLFFFFINFLFSLIWRYPRLGNRAFNVHSQL